MRCTRSHPATLALLTLCVASCGDTAGPQDRPATVLLSGPATEVAIGGTLQLAAAVLDATGVLMPGREVEWSSLDPHVASVSPAGLVTGLAGGTARIQAAAGAASGTLTVLVRTDPCSSTMVSGSLATGQTVNGGLTAADCIFMDGGYADGWTLAVPVTTGTRIDLASTDADITLVVTDQDMEVVAWGDRAADGTVRVVHPFAPGTYIVWVVGVKRSAIAPYSLAALPATMCGPESAVGSMVMNGVVTGSITQDSCLLLNGRLSTGWRFSTSTEATARVRMEAIGFMPRIVATDMDLNPIAISSLTGTSGTAELLANLPPGDYMVWATSVAGGTGIFALSMTPAIVPP